jgi:hypothetical protein
MTTNSRTPRAELPPIERVRRTLENKVASLESTVRYWVKDTERMEGLLPGSDYLPTAIARNRRRIAGYLAQQVAAEQELEAFEQIAGVRVS